MTHTGVARLPVLTLFPVAAHAMADYLIAVTAFSSGWAPSLSASKAVPWPRLLAGLKGCIPSKEARGQVDITAGFSQNVGPETAVYERED